MFDDKGAEILVQTAEKRQTPQSLRGNVGGSAIASWEISTLGTAIFAKVPKEKGQARRRCKGRGLTSLWWLPDCFAACKVACSSVASFASYLVITPDVTVETKQISHGPDRARCRDLRSMYHRDLPRLHLRPPGSLLAFPVRPASF